MIVSQEEAFLVLAKWLENSPLLRIILLSSSGMFNAIGSLESFEQVGLELKGSDWELTIPFAGATFAFADPRESDSIVVRAPASEQYECGLELKFPDGDRLILLELKGYRYRLHDQ